MVSARDQEILRSLAQEIAAVAALPEQEERRVRWRDLNALKPGRPLVWINEIPWHEMDVDGELALRCEDSYLRGVETGLRRTLYQWRHLPADMVVDGVVHVPHAYKDSGYGLAVEAHRPEMAGGAAQFTPVLQTLADVEKIHPPVIEADWPTTSARFGMLSEVFQGVLPVKLQGICCIWCAPWDVLIQWYGIEKLYLDMTDNPDLVHAAIRRMMDAYMARLDQFEAQDLLGASNGNHRVGSGGLGITDELPAPGCDPAHVRARDLWGTSTGQIFSEVSPDMHEEFCLQYEKPWLARFGLACYGCCEPLHNKMHLLRKVPNLRRVSMSPFIDLDQAVAAVGRDYVFSAKPNPSVLAWDRFEPAAARADLERWVHATRGLAVELILKDIHTVRNDPRRLWHWARIAHDVANN